MSAEGRGAPNPGNRANGRPQPAARGTYFFFRTPHPSMPRMNGVGVPKLSGAQQRHRSQPADVLQATTREKYRRLTCYPPRCRCSVKRPSFRRLRIGSRRDPAPPTTCQPRRSSAVPGPRWVPLDIHVVLGTGLCLREAAAACAPDTFARAATTPDRATPPPNSAVLARRAWEARKADRGESPKGRCCAHRVVTIAGTGAPPRAGGRRGRRASARRHRACVRASSTLYWTVRSNCCVTAFELFVAVIVIG